MTQPILVTGGTGTLGWAVDEWVTGERRGRC
jgi:nucleoside-diphosphate-sugar epimerase